MKKQFRVKNNQRFGEIVHQGKCKKNASFIVHYLDNNDGFLKFGISVSKKIGKAVVRNKIKRQIRAMLNQLVDFTSNSLDIVIIIKSQYLLKTYQENLYLLDKILNDLLEKK